MSIRDKLMSYKEFHGLKDREVPYEYTLEKENNYLYYFGSKHIFNLKEAEEIRKPLKNFWKDFLENTDGQKFVFIEGTAKDVVPDQKFESEEEAIEKWGEGGLITYLARKENIQVKGPEPGPKECAKRLEEKFSKEQIFYYYTIRSLAYRYKKRGNNRIEDIDSFLEDLISKWKDQLGWKDFDFSTSKLEEIHKNNFSGKFNPYDYKFFDAIRRPGWKSTITNKIAQETGQIRNQVIVEEIWKEINENKNVFTVFGLAHAYMQEPALRSLFGDN
ncbi:MAG: hypothetical protein ABEI53_00685 [Candidatus Magasanikbacteria bacterium]